MGGTRRTFRITDPAPVILELQPRRNRGVRCILFVRRRGHNSLNLFVHWEVEPRKNDDVEPIVVPKPTPQKITIRITNLVPRNMVIGWPDGGNRVARRRGELVR